MYIRLKTYDHQTINRGQIIISAYHLVNDYRKPIYFYCLKQGVYKVAHSPKLVGKEIKWGREEGERLTGKRERMAGFKLVGKKSE